MFLQSAKLAPANAAELPAPANPRYQMLDIWRGVACLMIVVLHASFYFACDDSSAIRAESPIGGMIHSAISRFGSGVHLFFVISGYCIAATVDASRRRSNVGADFFIRRFRRIFPPYWFALLFTIALVVAATTLGFGPMISDAGKVDTGVLPQPGGLSAWQWIGNLTLTEHWRYHVIGNGELKLLGPSWSLCYEEQFYAICGLILLVAPRWFFKGAIIVSLFTVAMMTLAMQLGGLHTFNGFFFDGRWLLFAVGVLVYHHINYSKALRSLATPAVLLAAFLSLGMLRYGVLRGATADTKARCFELLVAVGFGITLLTLHRWDRQISNVRLLAPLAWCGRMCYSLYLIHWPVSKLISAALHGAGVRGVWPTLLISVPVCLAASLAASYAFYRLIECRFMNTSSRKTRPISHESLATVSMPVTQPA